MSCLQKFGKRINNKWKKRIIVLFFFTVMATVPFVLYSNTLIIDSTGELNFNPDDYFSRIVNAWDSRYAPGRETFPSQLLFQMSAFFAVFHTVGLPVFLIERMWFIFILFLSGISMYYFTGILKLGILHRLLSSLFFMFNPYTLLMFNITSDFLLLYAIFPVFFGLWHKGIRDSPSGTIKNSLLIALVALLVFPHNMTFVIMVIAFLLSYFVFYSIFIDRVKFIYKAKFVIFTGLFTILSSGWWLLSAISYFYTAITNISANLLYETPLMYNSSSSFLEIFRLLGFWGFYSGYQNEPYFNYSSSYINNPLIILVSFVIPTIALGALLFRKGQKSTHEREGITLFLGIVLIISLFMAVGSFPPQNPTGTGQIFQWLYNNVPGFQIFRDGYKFEMFTAFIYSVYLGVFLDELNKTVKKNRLPKRCP